MKLVVISLFIIMGFSLAFGMGQIDIAYSPYTISNPGSYIVVRDLSTPLPFNGITIQANNVFLDLNGHTLTGTGIVFAGTTSYGIYGDTTNNNISVINGTIKNGLRGGINLGGDQIQISRVKSYNNGGDGIRVGNGSTISDCIIANNRNYGINIGNSGTIKNNTVLSNGTNQSISGIATGFGAIITGNSCQYNGYHGIITSYGSIITGNLCQYNILDGVVVTDQCTLIGNTVNYNNNIGISTGNSCTIKNNTASGNGSGGILAGSFNNIVENTLSNQSVQYSAGIYIYSTHNRIDSNHVCGNYYGIYFSSPANWCGRNTLSTNTTNLAGSVPADPGTGFSNFTTF